MAGRGLGSGGAVATRAARVIAVLTVLLLAGGLTEPPPRAEAQEQAALPHSMVAIGDSISTGFNTGGLFNNFRNVWSTGWNATVNSHYLRILASEPAIEGRNHNVALAGARMSDFARQAGNAVATQAEYVTVLLGANDVCTSSELTMTPAPLFESQFRSGMDALASGLPNARVRVASIPDIYHLWEVYYTSFFARTVWSLLRVCQSMLANAGSTSAVDMDRRRRVRDHNIVLNQVLENVCRQYANCDFDGYATFNTRFTRAEVGGWDYFHPSVSGQALLSHVTYNLGGTGMGIQAVDPAIRRETEPTHHGWWNDTVTISVDQELLSTGAVEYRLRDPRSASHWQRYKDRIEVSDEGTTEVTVRSVDAAGDVVTLERLDVAIDRTPPTLRLRCPTGPVPVGGKAWIELEAQDKGGSGFAEDPSYRKEVDTSLPQLVIHEEVIVDRAGNEARAFCSFRIMDRSVGSPPRPTGR